MGIVERLSMAMDRLTAACFASLIIIGAAVTFMLLYPTEAVPQLLTYLCGTATTFLFGVGVVNTVIKTAQKLAA